jgi:hypothetical protein
MDTGRQEESLAVTLRPATIPILTTPPDGQPSPGLLICPLIVADEIKTSKLEEEHIYL